MFEQDFVTREDARLREKQDKCIHPSFKCSTCGVYKDNLFNDYQAEIDLLHLILDERERLLTVHNISFISYRHIIKDSIISTYLKEKMNEYISKRRRTEG